MSSDKKDRIVSAETAISIKSDKIAASRDKWRNLIAFWILGFCNNYGYYVMLTAAHDILHDANDERKFSNVTGPDLTKRICNKVSTGAILLADVLPSMFIKIVAPFLPFHVRFNMATCILSSILSLGLVSQGPHTWVKIVGVALTSLSLGLGEVTMLSYSHRYSKNVISTWSSGTGGAGIVSAGSYILLKKWFKGDDALLVMLVVPVVQALTFWLLLTHREPTLTFVGEDGIGSKQQIIEETKMSFKDKLRLLPSLMKYMIPLCLVYLFEYFINQGLYELIDFRNIDFLSHDEQYRYLDLDYKIGVFISRSSINIFSIDNIWLMSVLQFLNVVILTSEAIWYYIPNIWIVFIIVLWEGMLGGSAYVNTYYKLSKEVPWEKRQVSLGIVAMSDAFGTTLAGWLAMPVHNAICQLPLPQRLGSK